MYDIGLWLFDLSSVGFTYKRYIFISLQYSLAPQVQAAKSE